MGISGQALVHWMNLQCAGEQEKETKRLLQKLGQYITVVLVKFQEI